MASTRAESRIGFLQIAISAVTLWGFGVSVGCYLPAAQTPESLAQKLTHLCSTYEHIQTSALCHTTIAAKLKVEEWTEATSGSVPQERLDAELVDFLSAVVSTEHDRFLGKVTCGVTAPMRPETCPTLPTLPNRTEQAIQVQHNAGKLAVNQLKQSRFYRTLSLLARVGTWFWKYALFSAAGLIAGNVFGARYFFWPWVCFPWIWFFKDAPALYVVGWWAFASFTVHDMAFMQYKVSRGLIFAGLLVLTCMNLAWYIVKGNREVSFSLFCFLAVAVPLDPLFEVVLALFGSAAIKLQGTAAGPTAEKLKG